MDPLGALWHFANFFTPAAGISLIAAVLVKLLWRRSAAYASWWRLWIWAFAAAAAVSVAGLLMYGRDGKMATYAGMVVATALTLRLIGLRHGD